MVQLNTAAVMRQSMEASKAGHMLMSLALLPSAKIQTGLDVIKVYIGAHNLEEEFRVILEYMENFWIGFIGVNGMSVADKPHRTNNALEGFYSRLLELAGAHPGVWKFHENVTALQPLKEGRGPFKLQGCKDHEQMAVRVSASSWNYFFQR
ncbi:uncharacterized protein LOC111048411 isoform X4 [Nilaparvata lugens]|nr:uncharacterized protein LOC111048411 isoform X4 [Nilaparvata lugens]XP_039276465.1 uncharacterized protein LOC111048411 isoform X4 [Nilaparvata lugens]